MADAEAFKAQGNKALQAKDFDGAIEAYSKAIQLDPKQHVYYSNRSAAYLSKGEAEKALEDADQCIKANPSWPKGYSRKGAALHSLKRYKDAAAAYEEGEATSLCQQQQSPRPCGMRPPPHPPPSRTTGLAVAPDDAALKSGLEDVRKAEEASTPRQNPFGMLFSPENLKRLEGHPKFGRYYADPGFRAKAEMMRMNPGMAQALLKVRGCSSIFSSRICSAASLFTMWRLGA
jgi:stress-induced-phosphoprotein 1